MRAFVFDNKDTPIIQHGDKVWIEEMSVRERQAERPPFMDKVSHPIFDFFALINFFCTIQFFFCIEFANALAIVMFVELIAALIKLIGGVIVGVKFEGVFVGGFSGGGIAK